MDASEMKRLFELVGDVVGRGEAGPPDPDALALMRAARRLEPDLDCLLAMRLLEACRDAPTMRAPVASTPVARGCRH